MILKNIKLKVKKENPIKNKTNWVALISAVLAFVPGVGPWIAANPEAYATLVGVAVTIARSFTVLGD